MEPQQPGGRALAARRADVGSVRLGARDIAGLVLCAEHYGAPYDLPLPWTCRPPGCAASSPGGGTPGTP
jgi:hypothetical protein